MVPTISTNSLAEALSKGNRQDAARGGDPLIDRLATALAVLPPTTLPEQADDDDDVDEDLDLPMLVQGSRVPAVVPVPVVRQRAREGRAALVGFALGLVLLVPIGVVMSNRMPNSGTTRADLSGLPANFMPETVATTDSGIRTTRRPTQIVPAFETMDEPAVAQSAPAEPIPTVPVTVAALPAPPPVILTPPPPAAPAPPPPDHLADAATLIGKGDITSARLKIQAADPATNPLAAMALAETFDPNMLAAWGIRGGHADVDRARSLYDRALGEGVVKARQRLEALD